jgi:hypothetical protein
MKKKDCLVHHDNDDDKDNKDNNNLWQEQGRTMKVEITLSQ